MELIENLNLENSVENNFFQSNLGQAINSAVDIGLKAILPNFIEDDIIEIKDAFIEEGFSEAIDTAIEKAVSLGKTAIGTITGSFETVSQAKKAIEKGGLIDGVSDAIDFVLKKAKSAGLISKDVSNLIKNSKNAILNTVSTNIENEFDIQNEKIEKLQNYNNKWKEAFENKDFKKMSQNMKKIQKILSNIIPIENVINESRTMENLHELIKNNGKNFDLNEEEINLAKMLN